MLKQNEFYVAEYENLSSLINIIANESQSNNYILAKKRQISYINEYLNTYKSKKILVEKSYVDKDYIIDYSNYYSRCFLNYSKKTVRLHFFYSDVEKIIEENNIIKILSERRSDKYLNEARKYLESIYLGYIIIRPFIHTVIGKTCLKSPPALNNTKYINTTYSINLFGLNLTISSLAFQEQDKVVAKCATVSLWVAYQITSRKYNHEILSPYMITSKAVKQMLNNRTFPNSGLLIEQMVNSIKTLGMEPTIQTVKNIFQFKAIVYGYMKDYGVPIIMGMDIYEAVEIKGSKQRKLNMTGKHAVVISGYSKEEYKGVKPDSYKNIEDVASVSSSISTLYIHDDQVGPYSLVKFINNNDFKDIEKDKIILSIEWKGSRYIAIPKVLILPLYHKIRLDINTIFKSILSFYTIVNTLEKQNYLDYKDGILWDISLIENALLKKEILSSIHIDKADRYRFLTLNLPKYLWVVRATYSEKPLLDLIFDATDFSEGSIFITPIFYDSYFENLIYSLIDEDKLIEMCETVPGWNFYLWFKNHINTWKQR